jgi:hypothetical protein
MEVEAIPLFDEGQVPYREIPLFFCPGQLGSCTACGRKLGLGWIGLECIEITECSSLHRSFLGLYHSACGENAAFEILDGGDWPVFWSDERIRNLAAYPGAVGRRNNIRDVLGDSLEKRLGLLRAAGLWT